MKKIKLYIAVSLDGYIARTDGSLEWIAEMHHTKRADHGFNELMESVDTVIMGGKTYHEFIGYQVEWPYKDKTTYVISHHDTNLNETDHVIFLTDDVFKRITALKKEEGKDIWLVGGGKLISMLLNWDLIDEMQIYYVPVILGDGVALFGDKTNMSKWEVTKCERLGKGVMIWFDRAF